MNKISRNFNTRIDDDPLPFPNYPTNLHCEHCDIKNKDHDSVWMHFGNPIVHYAGDEYHPDNPLGLRGNWIEIPCLCEFCHNITSIIVAFHKGMMYITCIKTKTMKSVEGNTYVSNGQKFVDITRTNKQERY